MEFLNKLTRIGLNPHHLHMKKSMVLMLLRSLSPMQGHCNGARLMLWKANNIHLYCKIASVDNAREELLIPRIEIKHQDGQFIDWNRRQFSIRPAFVITINRRQGQTRRSVGFWPEQLTFTHVQLHAVAWRVENPHHLHLAVNMSDSWKTRNDVCKNILQTGEVDSLRRICRWHIHSWILANQVVQLKSNAA